MWGDGQDRVKDSGAEDAQVHGQLSIKLAVPSKCDDRRGAYHQIWGKPLKQSSQSPKRRILFVWAISREWYSPRVSSLQEEDCSGFLPDCSGRWAMILTLRLRTGEEA